MNFRRNLRAFAKAVVVGTLAGAWLPTIFTVFAAIAMFDEATGVWGAAATTVRFVATPSILAICFVLPCAVLVGLPATWLFRLLRIEHPEVYALLGGLTGAILPSTFFWTLNQFASWPLIFLGAFSGAITGWVWGVERRKLSDENLV